MRGRHLTWLLAALTSAACDAGPAEPPSAPFLGAQAELYLTGALDIMEAHSIRKYEIDWVEFRAAARADAEAAAAVQPRDTYPAIIAALERIGDGHSFFRPPDAELLLSITRVEGPSRADPSAGLVAPGVGYLDVPAFEGGGAVGDSLADVYHRLIEEVDTLDGSCRWVVDLRGNTGGNMWPMLAGVGPILGAADTVGFFVDADSVVTPWFYQAGEAGVSDSVTVARASSAYALSSPNPFVAVLTDERTASSGEAIAVAFRGRADARSFGDATWGVSTANAAYPLIDGAVIFLTVARMADRTGVVYGEELPPDEVVSGGSKTGDPATDPVLGAAVDWLEGRACS